MKLNEVSVGESCKIASISAEEDVEERLRLLNVYVGATVTVLRFSPFQSSVLIETDASRVALRTSLAKKISVVQA